MRGGGGGGCAAAWACGRADGPRAQAPRGRSARGVASAAAEDGEGGGGGEDAPPGEAGQGDQAEEAQPAAEGEGGATEAPDEPELDWRVNNNWRKLDKRPEGFYDTGKPHRDDPDWVWEWDGEPAYSYDDLPKGFDYWHLVKVDGVPLEDDYITTEDGEVISITGDVANAHLCSEAMAEIHAKHKEDPNENTVEALAEEYNIGWKRCFAIIQLQEFENRFMSGELELPAGNKWDRTIVPKMKKWYDEKHCRLLSEGYSREPHRRVFPLEPMFKFGTKEELDKEIEESEHPTDEQIVKREERQLNAQFKERLLYNMGFVGAGIRRNPGSTKHGARLAPPKPKGGYDILVTPLHGKKGGRAQRNTQRQIKKIQRIGLYKGPFMESEDARWKRLRPFVSKPDGSHRPLSKDELAFQRRRKPGLVIPKGSLYHVLGR